MYLTRDEAERIPLADRLGALTDLLPEMERPGASWGEWSPTRRQPDGTLVMPWFDDSPLAGDFHTRAYRAGWVQRDFAWSVWDQGWDRLNGPDRDAFIAAAEPRTLANIITALVRSERFNEGALAGAFTSGVLTLIVRRMRALLDELQPGGSSRSSGNEH